VKINALLLIIDNTKELLLLLLLFFIIIIHNGHTASRFITCFHNHFILRNKSTINQR